MRCKGSVKGMKHKINFVLFSNLLPFDEIVHFNQRRTPLKNIFISFIKKIVRSFGSSRKSANFALAVRK